MSAFGSWGGIVKRQMAICVMLAVQIWCAGVALAGPWEDGMSAYNRGDYVPALQVFRAMAREGSADAQAALGTMYRRGQGVAKSPARAFIWLTRAASRGNPKAKAELRAMSQTMTRDELAHAREMMVACEATDYRTCAY